MKSVWKWVIGIVVVLLVITSIACAHVFVGKYMVGMKDDYRSFRSFELMPHMDMVGQFHQFDDDHGMMTQSYGHSYPRVRPGFSFLRGLFPLALLGLLLYGAYHFGTRKASKPGETTVLYEEVVEAELKESEVAGVEKTCTKCDQVLQEEWRNCPHCGKRQ